MNMLICLMAEDARQRPFSLTNQETSHIALPHIAKNRSRALANMMPPASAAVVIDVAFTRHTPFCR
jgi:hypothetical protein